ncbi:MAG: YbaB/EbfC family nucleoid-associated protein [Candidatus Cloacimonadota bacterium]|nr:MAG: YbaB/EbfC family nucleoid-associated protein [Candidatus Cloacimonadota bacterium]
MFPGGKKGMKDFMRQAQKMQQDLLKTQEDLANKIVETTSGGGMVSVKMDGKYNLKNIKINPECVDPDDVEMLEDLILSAINDAVKKISKTSEDEMSKLTGGMNIPGLF